MDYQAENYGLIEKSEEAGFILVAPNGTSRFRSGIVTDGGIVLEIEVLADLVDRASIHPPLIGGKVQLVFNHLRSVVESPREQAQGFISAAQLCVRLIHSLSATTLRARDLIKELLRENETPAFVRRFFGEHISELYVRDFKNLRTENHPLRLRGEILDMVSQVTTEPVARAELLAGAPAKIAV